MQKLTRTAEPSGIVLALHVGRIAYVDPLRGVCKIQPLDGKVSRANEATAPLANVSGLSEAFVKDTDIYHTHEYVLYVDYAKGSGGAKPLQSAIILCRVPAYETKYRDVKSDTAAAPGDFVDYYKLSTELTDRAGSPAVEYIVKKWLEARTGGDKLFEGKNTLLRISDELIQMLGERCGIHVNSVDSSVELHGITKSESFIGTQSRGVLENDTVTQIKRTTGSISRANRKPVDTAAVDIETVEGDLAYGSVTTLFGKTAPLLQQQIRQDGSIHHKAVSGIVFEKTVDIEAYRPVAAQSVIYDEKLAKADTKLRKPFQRVTKSDNWKKQPSDAPEAARKHSYVRKPGLGAAEYKTKAINDVDELDIYAGKVSFGALPDGGFIIRDAWGSELRFINGDIQISAARNIQMLSGGDLVGIIGGVASLTAIGGVDVGTKTGSVNILSGVDVNLSGNTVTFHGKNDIDMVSEKDVIIKSIGGSVAVNGEAISITAQKELLLTGQRSYVVAANDALIAGSNSIVRCGATLDLAGTMQGYGTLRMSDNGYGDVTIGGTKISPTSGSGDIITPGSVLADKLLRANGNLVVSGSGTFGKLATADARKVEGGLGFGGSIRTAPKPFNVDMPKTPSTVNTKAADAIKAKASAVSRESILTTMFKAAKSFVAFIRPLFCGKHDNTAKIGEPPVIDIAGKKQYIYPGETFWKSSGVVTVNNIDKVDSVYEEVMDTTPTQGGSELQL